MQLVERLPHTIRIHVTLFHILELFEIVGRFLGIKEEEVGSMGIRLGNIQCFYTYYQSVYLFFEICIVFVNFVCCAYFTSFFLLAVKLPYMAQI